MQLTRHEQHLIVAALYAVAPSGGGSDPFHLAMKLANHWSVDLISDVFNLEVGRFQTTAHNEYMEGQS